MTTKNSAKIEVVTVPGWPAPRGYVNGVLARGRRLYVAGQVGWNERQEFDSDGMVDQFGRALDNVLAIVRAAGAGPESVAKMTIYVTDIPAYRGVRKQLGAIWRERFGAHYPAMALVGVTELVEPRAKIEIEAEAVLEDE